MNNTLNQANDFLRANAWWMALSVAALILIVVLIIFLTGRKRKSPGRKQITVTAYFEALGGSDNIISHTRNGSRISLVLKDYELLDKEKIKEAGVDSFIKMSDRLILVIKGDAEAVDHALFGSNEEGA